MQKRQAVSFLTGIMVGIIILDTLLVLNAAQYAASVSGQETITGAAIGTVGVTIVRPPNVTLYYPMNGTTLTTAASAFAFNVSGSNNISSCVLYMNGSAAKKKTNVSREVSYFTLNNLTSGSNTWRINCIDTIELQGTSPLSTFAVVIDPNDLDGDGISDQQDPLIGTNASIGSSTWGNLIMQIDNSSDVSQNFTGVHIINLTGDGMEIASFSNNFSSHTLNLTQVVVEKQDASSTVGTFSIKNVQLPPGATKTAFLDKVDVNITSVCIKDKEGVDITNISSACDASDETLLSCDGSVTGQYNCTDIGSRFRIDGLSHSAGKQVAISSTTSTASSAPLPEKSKKKQKQAAQAPAQVPQPSQLPVVQKPSPVSVIQSGLRPPTPPSPAALKKASLFDVAVRILPGPTSIQRGDIVSAEVTLFNLYAEQNKKIDVTMYYALIDPENNIVAEKAETVGVETKVAFETSLQLPQNARLGQYKFYAKAAWGNEIGETFDQFTVGTSLLDSVISAHNSMMSTHRMIIWILAIFCILLMTLVLVLWQDRRYNYCKIDEHDFARHNLIKCDRIGEHHIDVYMAPSKQKR